MLACCIAEEQKYDSGVNRLANTVGMFIVFETPVLLIPHQQYAGDKLSIIMKSFAAATLLFTLPCLKSSPTDSVTFRITVLYVTTLLVCHSCDPEFKSMTYFGRCITHHKVSRCSQEQANNLEEVLPCTYLHTRPVTNYIFGLSMVHTLKRAQRGLS